ncbi:MAG: hypothetical protein ABIJ37_09615 [Pseudomonadota bacterium]
MLKTERRDFDRFSINFVLEVFAEDVGGDTFKGKSILKDISGEGAKFVSLQADKYFLGQSNTITIYLPEAGGIKARMKERAIVVRIDTPNGLDISKISQGTEVAIKIDKPLNFERLDKEI